MVLTCDAPRGVDGSRQIVSALVDVTGTGKSFTAATVTKNGTKVRSLPNPLCPHALTTSTPRDDRTRRTSARSSSRSHFPPRARAARRRTSASSRSRPRAGSATASSSRTPLRPSAAPLLCVLLHFPLRDCAHIHKQKKLILGNDTASPRRASRGPVAPPRDRMNDSYLVLEV